MGVLGLVLRIAWSSDKPEQRRCHQENLHAQLKHGVCALQGAGGQPGEQLGLHGDDRVGLEPEGLAGAAGRSSGPPGAFPYRSLTRLARKIRSSRQR